MKKQNIHLFVPGSLCIAYSITNDDHTDNLILTLHGNNSSSISFLSNSIVIIPVIRARQLSILDSDQMNTFVKVKKIFFFEIKIIIFYYRLPILINMNNLQK